jgi:hypothetical protein
MIYHYCGPIGWIVKRKLPGTRFRDVNLAALDRMGAIGDYELL